MSYPQLKFYYEHRDEILKYRADYYEENKEKINERSKHYFKSYYEKNKSKIMKRVSIYNKKFPRDPELIKEYNKNYYEKKRKEKIVKEEPIKEIYLINFSIYLKEC